MELRTPNPEKTALAGQATFGPLTPVVLVESSCKHVSFDVFDVENGT